MSCPASVSGRVRSESGPPPDRPFGARDRSRVLPAHPQERPLSVRLFPARVRQLPNTSSVPSTGRLSLSWPPPLGLRANRATMPLHSTALPVLDHPAHERILMH